MSWLRTYIAVCASILGLAFVALVLLVSFADLGLSRQGTIALFVGALLTFAVTMALMGLLFMSSRGGHDESAHAAGERHELRNRPPPRR